MIYGNYRLAYLKYGLLTGVLLCLYLMVRHWVGAPVATPADFGKDLCLIVAMVYAMVRYRRQLPGERVTWKELMLLGLGMGVIAGIVYGLFVWQYCGWMYPDMLDRFANASLPADANLEQLTVVQNAVMWGLIYGFIHTALTTVIVAFFCALLFRSERNAPTSGWGSRQM